MTTTLDIASTASQSLTLLDLQRMVRATLETRFAEPLWISAEISELKVNRSGHCYLNLVEKGTSDTQPKAEARAVIWKTAYARLASLFRSATGQSLTSGIRILARVMVTYHEVYGFSLQIIDLDASYTLGEIERRRRETIARLQADGVWDMNRDLDLTPPTLRIAIVSSATAAGYRDFMQELGRTPYHFRTTLFESIMQGEAGEQSVVEALTSIATREEEFDAVVIIRGGGSTIDLALFDSYLIASHIAQFPLCIFTGIGHDKDVSVADMVAYRACKTPTAVALTLAELADEQMARLEEYALRLQETTIARLANERIVVERLKADIARTTAMTLNNATHRTDKAEEGISEAARTLLKRERERLEGAKRVVESHSVERLLRIGLAVVRSQGQSVGSVEGLNEGASLQIELADGVVQSTITKITKNQ